MVGTFREGEHHIPHHVDAEGRRFLHRRSLPGFRPETTRDSKQDHKSLVVVGIARDNQQPHKVLINLKKERGDTPGHEIPILPEMVEDNYQMNRKDTTLVGILLNSRNASIKCNEASNRIWGA
jgi:hypothetical protein